MKSGGNWPDPNRIVQITDNYLDQSYMINLLPDPEPNNLVTGYLARFYSVKSAVEIARETQEYPATEYPTHFQTPW